VGKPMNGAQVMVLDEEMQVCGIESIGEIYIRTPYISAGYYKNPEFTRKVFIRNPFSDNPKDVIYKTGDLGRMLPSGDVEIMGRADHQVKLRGVRIELGEIENQLLQFEKVKEAVVVALEDETNNKYLSAYIEVEGQKLDTSEIREFLQKRLPDYMIPTYFVQLEEMPLTPNGKIDRKALPVPGKNDTGVEYVAPQNEIEEKLVEIWSEVLGVEEIGINHNFFDIGGHSLRAATLVAKIHQKLDVEVPLKEVFANSTVKKLAEYIQKADKNIYIEIKPIEKREYYPVSSAQKRLYVLNRLEGAGTTYNMPRTMIVEGSLEVERFSESFKTLINRHESLRTSFKTIDGDIVQRVHEVVDFEVSYLESEENELTDIVKEFIKPFVLKKAPLLRVELIKFSNDRHLLLFDMHHIISDGFSMDILIRELIAIYHGRSLPELKIQYKDFSVWQNELFATDRIERHERYWLDRFVNPQIGEIPVLNMPTDYPRPLVQSFEGSKLSFVTDTNLTVKLNELVKETGSTLYMVLLAAYNALLSKYTGQEDIIVGSPIAGRSHADLQNIIGVFINMLPMRNYPESHITFKEFLKAVKENALKAYEHQNYQFEQLVEKLSIRRDLSRNPLFDTMFVLHNTENEVIEINDLKFAPYNFNKTISKYDITINAEEQQGKIGFGMEYSTKLFKHETMERLANHFITILKQIAQNTEVKLGDIDILSEEDKTRILVDFNNTEIDYPKEKRLNELFEEQVVRTPENIAIVFGDKELTYNELNVQTNQIARILRDKGVKEDSIVGIMVERSLEMMIGILSILKAGGAYLPIDPEYPAERIKYMVEDSQAEIVLTQKKVLEKLQIPKIESIRIDEDDIYQGEETNLNQIGGSENLAYVIYTSGSTGKPKGVMIEHIAVNNFIKGITEKIEFTSDKSILALTTISFDIFVLETLLPLTKGLRVVITNEDQQKDNRALSQIIIKNKIDMLQMTPSRMKMLIIDKKSALCLQNVKEIMIGGEAFPKALLEEIREVTMAKIYNMYGPTETTVWSSIKDLSESEEINIGRPIANTAIYILDKSDHIQPIGVPGELCIAGDGLARGYLNKPELTAEKFKPNQFSPRMFRTGDLARWLPDGNIDFFGRIDHQVKIRGYRIELGEIESQLLRHEDINETVVLAKEELIRGKYLCAYLVSEKKLTSAELRAHLSIEIPDYMIPAYFIHIDKIPFTPNGKIDRKALPELDSGIDTGVEYVPPTNEVEKKLIEIWEEVLEIEEIGINHDFFEIGGNSINILKIINRINQEFTGVVVSMSELFLKSTIAEIANDLFMENPFSDLDCVVGLNKPVDDKKNIFIIHNREGIIYQYKELAKLLEGAYNFYGMQAKGLLKPTVLPETMKGMVTDYICEMKAIQPKGPYIVGGFCWGNWLAYKMVEMLEERGVEVEKLILIDENVLLPDAFVKYLQTRSKMVRPFKMARNITRKVTKNKDRNPMDYWSNVEEYKKSMEISVDIQNERTVKENVDYVCGKRVKEIKNIIEADIFVIKAEDNDAPKFTQEAWSEMTHGKVSFCELPGGHDDLLSFPYVERLADEIRNDLNKIKD
ncbi:MAG: amino acid adenylation domain-containing protein, partial [Halanaerobiales bacterium]|nr:amino acid adenylation domain-containing protein [Halanaerobiales bacterium]